MKNFKPIKPATVKVVAHTRKAPTRSNKRPATAKTKQNTLAPRNSYPGKVKATAKNQKSRINTKQVINKKPHILSPVNAEFPRPGSANYAKPIGKSSKPIVVNDTKNVIKNTEKSSSGSRSTVNWRTNHKAAINKQAEVQVFHDKIMNDPSASFAEKQRATARLNEVTDAVQGTAPTQAQDSQFKQEAKQKQAKAGAYMLGGGAVLGVAERNNKRNNDADIATSEQMANAMKGW